MKLNYRFLVFFIFLIIINPVRAQEETRHFTLIINQVRGEECCGVGKIENLSRQLDLSKHLNITAHFAIRYDALINSQYLDLLKKYTANNYGAFLEITPDLAIAAGVEYKGDQNYWNNASNVFLVGYAENERKLLIDEYMRTFLDKFGNYPQYSVAWMIDPWSLKYLRANYGVIVHEITREQYSTDSYTLTGGPVHYPYWPSEKWAIIPFEQFNSMPLIVRQTIMDPVFCYGDETSSYTSQPNDYMQRGVGIEYFQHLFEQAHQQLNEYTFALIGLENSMDLATEDEYEKQLNYLAQWQKKDDNNIISGISEFESYLRKHYQAFNSYSGRSTKDNGEQAIWINTSKYRARLRLSKSELFISDLRIYDQEFEDPYIQTPAGLFGWWIVPFTIDGSRYFTNKQMPANTITNDSLKNRLQAIGDPSRISILNDIKNDSIELVREKDKIIIIVNDIQVAEFNNENFQINGKYSILSNSLELKNVSDNLVYYSNNNSPLWGYKVLDNYFKPFYTKASLNQERITRPALLFPELTKEQIDPNKSFLYVNNQYAVAGRNPVRLIFYPKDQLGNPIYLKYNIGVKTNKSAKVSTQMPHGSNGMIFIDITNDTSEKVDIELTAQDYSKELSVYFTPNCKNELKTCLFNPAKLWWYLQGFIDDKLRVKKGEEYNNINKFVEN